MKILKTMPGIALSMAIAFLALWLESLLPIHVVGASVIAMFIGMTLNYFLKNIDIFNAGAKFTSKKILKFAIILLGLSLNINTIFNVGKMSLVVMVFTLLTCFGGGYFIGNGTATIATGFPSDYYGTVLVRSVINGTLSPYYHNSNGQLRGWDGSSDRVFSQNDTYFVSGVLFKE
jgi:putative flippase GtrA